ncbi:hypothetical protein GUITHDRAFT_150271 [Guillardia theta CCMP2712]|uniref:EF-hand domain-containing protein n=1 Tax=Guillardia theta (strain CCMP2712) TaxID=905079 RepID=L1JZI8_GUITC|nr:hypothetical protein GUITHDRAFT_150271 [Guillardia theta CCMP2712]EKX53719.1 hypothetical protein GUITHDRAFT_150271 [Guillardia theta CCMP2712]|eukprot:XP_005840699.1 hypothetical protein GUITHDRAFT_150271 [Guillardia theta CCMP2712]
MSKESSVAPWMPDVDKVRSKFDHYDVNGDGELDEGECIALAKDLIASFQLGKVDESQIKQCSESLMSRVDGLSGNQDNKIQFEEFLPWYIQVAEEHWRLLHPSTKEAAAHKPREDREGQDDENYSPESVLSKISSLRAQVAEIRTSLKTWDSEFEEELEKCIQELPAALTAPV